MCFRAKTGADRRLALQIAIQLPEGVADARRVLDLTCELLDEFMVEQSARRRALELGWRLDGDRGADARLAGRPTPDLWIIALALCSLCITLPIGMLLYGYAGCGAGLSLAFGVIAVAIVLGRLPALAVAVVSALAYNLLMVPPLVSFTVPSTWEVVMAAGYGLLALMVPLMAEHRDRIRGVALIPLQRLALARRA